MNINLFPKIIYMEINSSSKLYLKNNIMEKFSNKNYTSEEEIISEEIISEENFFKPRISHFEMKLDDKSKNHPQNLNIIVGKNNFIDITIKIPGGMKENSEEKNIYKEPKSYKYDYKNVKSDIVNIDLTKDNLHSRLLKFVTPLHNPNEIVKTKINTKSRYNIGKYLSVGKLKKLILEKGNQINFTKGLTLYSNQALFFDNEKDKKEFFKKLGIKNEKELAGMKILGPDNIEYKIMAVWPTDLIKSKNISDSKNCIVFYSSKRFTKSKEEITFFHKRVEKKKAEMKPLGSLEIRVITDNFELNVLMKPESIIKLFDNNVTKNNKYYIHNRNSITTFKELEKKIVLVEEVTPEEIINPCSVSSEGCCPDEKSFAEYKGDDCKEIDSDNIINQVKMPFIFFNYLTSRFDFKTIEVDVEKSNSKEKYYIVKVDTSKKIETLSVKESDGKISLVSPKVFTISSGLGLLILMIVTIIGLILYFFVFSAKPKSVKTNIKIPQKK